MLTQNSEKTNSNVIDVNSKFWEKKTELKDVNSEFRNQICETQTNENVLATVSTNSYFCYCY